MRMLFAYFEAFRLNPGCSDPDGGCVAQGFDETDFGLVFDLESPAATLAAITARRDMLANNERVRFRDCVIIGLERAFGNGTRAGGDWFEILLDAAIFSAPEAEFDLGSDECQTFEKRLCDLLFTILDGMDPETRGERAISATRRLADISLLCTLVAASEHERGAAYFDTALPDLAAALLERISDLAKTTAFWAQRFPAAMLWIWFVHGEEQRVYDFTSRAMHDPRGLEALLTLPLEQVELGGERQNIVAVRRWSRIIDFRALEMRAVALAMSAPSSTDRRRARLYLDAFANGKSELFR
jgi:hypothetical protein